MSYSNHADTLWQQIRAVVLQAIPPGATAAGIPAKVVGHGNDRPSRRSGR
ncbi:hypothetical protein [Carnimonas bestiolae]